MQTDKVKIKKKIKSVKIEIVKKSKTAERLTMYLNINNHFSVTSKFTQCRFVPFIG